MITLILYNAHHYICFAIANEKRILHTASIYSPKNSTERYIPYIEHAFSMLSLSPSAIERIVCTNGPSSFTATRLIVSTALGIALPYSIPIAPISTLCALAYNCPLETDCLWVALPAQKHTFYTQCFHVIYNSSISSSLHVQSCTPISIMTYQEFMTILVSLKHAYIIGDESLHSIYYQEIPSQCVLLPIQYAMPSAFSLYIYSQHAQYSTNPPQICYMRKTDAEEHITDIAYKLGYSSQEIKSIYTKYEPIDCNDN